MTGKPDIEPCKCMRDLRVSGNEDQLIYKFICDLKVTGKPDIEPCKCMCDLRANGMEEQGCGKFVCNFSASWRLGKEGRGCSPYRMRAFLPLH